MINMFLNLTLPGGIGISSPEGFAFGDESNIGTILGGAIPMIMMFAGIILFLMIIAGGFTMLTAVGNPEKVKKGQTLLTNSVIGFVIVFAAYWIMQILQIAFGMELGF